MDNMNSITAIFTILGFVAGVVSCYIGYVAKRKESRERACA